LVMRNGAIDIFGPSTEVLQRLSAGKTRPVRFDGKSLATSGAAMTGEAPVTPSAISVVENTA